MEDNIEEWKSMTAQQLMNKKDSIEEEIKSLHDELENVKIIGYGGRFAPSLA